MLQLACKEKNTPAGIGIPQASLTEDKNMNMIKKTLAGLCAVCIGASASPFAGGTMESIMTVSAAEDILP